MLWKKGDTLCNIAKSKQTWELNVSAKQAKQANSKQLHHQLVLWKNRAGCKNVCKLPRWCSAPKNQTYLVKNIKKHLLNAGLSVAMFRGGLALSRGTRWSHDLGKKTWVVTLSGTEGCLGQRVFSSQFCQHKPYCWLLVYVDDLIPSV